jgi:hypothetical protein
MLMKCVALLATLAALLVGCSNTPTEEPVKSGVGAGTGTVAATATAPTQLCGASFQDWCPSPPGDPCGEHKNKASCQLDARCNGMHYRGESVVACKYNERGFATNCPTVGCISR